MRKPTWLNKEVFGWGMFDFANQAFTLVILTAVFNVYFTEHVAPEDRGVYYWSAAGIATQIMIIILAPILGALADFSGAKKKLLFITWLGCVVFTASLGLIPPGGIVIAPSLAYMDRAYADARREGWSREPVVEMLIPSTLDDSLAPKGAHVASLFCQIAARELPNGRAGDDHRGTRQRRLCDSGRCAP
jgi:MFS family permease